MAKKKPKESIPGWPKIWVNKRNPTKKFRVMPWWECLDPLMSDDGVNNSIPIGVSLTKGRKVKVGIIVQVGWLLENEHGVWFGVGPKAEKEFREVPK